MKKHLEFKGDKASRCWEIAVDGATCIVRYGRIGAKGTEKRTDFDNPKLAMQAAEKLVRQKLAKGYFETEATGGTPQAPQFQRITFNKAKKLLENLGEKVHIDMDEAEDKDLEFQLHRGDLCVDDLAVREAMIVDGTLTVNGELHDARDSDFTLLVVTGDLKAANLITFSSMSIGGDIDIQGVAYGNSLHDFGLFCGGDLRAPVIIENGHLFSAKNGLIEVSVMVGDKYEDSTNDRAMPLAGPDVLPREVLDADRKIDEEKLLEWIRGDKQLISKERLATLQKELAGQKRRRSLYDELLRFKTRINEMSLEDLGVEELFQEFREGSEEYKRLWDVFKLIADITEILVCCHRPKDLAVLLTHALALYGKFDVSGWPQWAKNKLRDMFVGAAWASHIIGNPEEAVAYAEKGRQIDAGWPLVHFLAALAHAQLDAANQAKEAMVRTVGAITLENSLRATPFWLSSDSQYNRKYLYQGQELSAMEILPRLKEAYQVEAHLEGDAAQGIAQYIEEKSESLLNENVPMARNILDWFG